MNECPYCASDLHHSPHRQQSRTDPSTGHKSPSNELVRCPDCGGVIDGFAAH